MGKRKRSDVAWQYCTVVDHNIGRIRCNFCGQVMWGGSLKRHLACIKGNVIPCRCCPPEVTAQIREDLHSPENEDDIDRGSEQVNDMRGGGNEEQFQEEEEYWQKLCDEIHEYRADGLPENEEDIGGGSEQVNDMRGGGNEEQLQPEHEIWRKFATDMFENLPDFSRKIQANIDWVSDWVGEQVNDMRGEGKEEQSQPKQECWPKSVGDDMFAYLFHQGLEARNLRYEMELKRVNDEYERAVEAARRQSELAFWEYRTRRGEGCSGTKPVPSCREYSMTSDDDSDDDSELGF